MKRLKIKKYLLIIKNDDIISFEFYKVHTALTLTEMSLISDHYGQNSVCEWYCIDNFESHQVGQLLLTFTNFLKEHINGK